MGENDHPDVSDNVVDPAAPTPGIVFGTGLPVAHLPVGTTRGTGSGDMGKSREATPPPPHMEIGSGPGTTTVPSPNRPLIPGSMHAALLPNKFEGTDFKIWQ